MYSRTPLQSLGVALILGAVLLVGPGCVHLPYAWQSQQNSFAQIGPGLSHSLTNENSGHLASAARGWHTDWADWTFWPDVGRGWNADSQRASEP